MKSVPQALSHRGFKALLYLNDWLIQASDYQQCKAHKDLILHISCKSGFLFNLAKSHLTPTQMIVLLGVIWDSKPAPFRLSRDNQCRMLSKVHHTFVTRNISHHQHNYLSGSLNHAAAILPMGWIHHHCLSFKGNHLEAGIEAGCW